MLYAIIIYYMWSVCFSKNDGVSPILGTILILAMTTVFVGIIGAAVVGGFGMAEPAPILGATIDQQGNIITISHMKGDLLPGGSYKILVDGVDHTSAFHAKGDFGPGMMLSWNSGMEPVGRVSIVYTGKTGATTLLTEKKIGKEADGFLKKYTLYKKKQWEDTLDEMEIQVANGDKTLLKGLNIYIEDGEYWLEGTRPSVILPPVYVTNRSSLHRIFELIPNLKNNIFVKIDISKKIYTSSDNDGVTWITSIPQRGDLYEYDNKLYVDIRKSITPKIDPRPGTILSVYAEHWILIGSIN